MSNKFSEDVAVLGVIDPADAAATAKSTDWADISKFERFAGIAIPGAIAAAIACKLQQATTATGAGAKQIGTCDLTFSTSADNKQCIIEGKADDLDTANSFRWARLTMTPATSGTNILTGIFLGYKPRYGPASDNDLASVDTIADPGTTDATITA